MLLAPRERKPVMTLHAAVRSHRSAGRSKLAGIVVKELNETSPSRIVELLQLDDPDVKPNSVRAILGLLTEHRVIAKRGRGCYVPAA